MPGPATPKLVSATVAGALALVMLVALLVPQAQAAFPGRNGALLVYGEVKKSECGRGKPRLIARLADFGPDQCDVAGPTGPFARLYKWKLIVRDVASARTLLTRDGASPDWSIKDLIAFTHNDRLYVMDRAGGHARLVPLPYTSKYDPRKPTSAIRASSPDWSPEGSRIAFVSRGMLMVVRSDGKGLRLVAKNAADPIWSPDGSLIAFNFPQPFSNVEVVSAKAGHNRVLPHRRVLISNANLLDWQAIPTRK